MRLALSGFLFEEAYRHQSLDIDDFCALAAEAGYEGVELRRTQVNPADADERVDAVWQAVRHHGLTVTCLTTRGMPTEDPARRVFLCDYLELCRRLHCGLLKIGGDAAFLCSALDEAATAGVTLARNNHVGGPLETIDGTRAFLERIGDARFGLLFDAMHLHAAGQDPVDAAARLAARTVNVLIHSVRPAHAGESPTMQTAAGDWVRCRPDEAGAPDWASILARLKGAGYDGWITVIESGWPEAERRDLAVHCAERLRQWWEAA